MASHPNSPGGPVPAAAPAARRAAVLASCLLAVLLVRLLTLGMPSLLDTTEGRYGAIALHMLQSGDWVTPRIPLAHGFEPYLGKPPLGFWAIAASLGVFGVSEWSARLPSLLAGVLMVGAVMGHARRRYDAATALLSGVILASTWLFFMLAGSVDIDCLLAALVTVAITAFCRVGDGPARGQRLWGLLFFASLGLGCLAKGPVAIALTGLAGIAHLLVHRNARIVTGLPWVGGGALFLAITVPWYWLAEQRNPGFASYFFVHENLERFVTRDYGDRYGAGRRHAHGVIWAWLLAATLPWAAPPLLALGGKDWRARAAAARRSEGAFLVLWAVSPALMFTFSPQFTAGYLLPGFGGFAILAARALQALCGSGAAMGVPLLRWLARAAALLGPLVAIAGWAFLGPGPVRGGAALLAGVVFAASATWRLGRATELAPAASWLASGLAVTFGVLLLVGSPFVSASRSVAPLLARFLAASPAGVHRIGLASSSSCSGWFYGPAWTGDAVRWRRLGLDQLATDGLDAVFVRNRDLRGVPAATMQRFRVVSATGGWTWLARR